MTAANGQDLVAEALRAIDNLDADALNELLDAGLDTNAIDPYSGYPLLHVAIDSEMGSEILEDEEELYTVVSTLLVRRGADLTATVRGMGARAYVSYRGHERFLAAIRTGP